jgi:hypothetical protein
MDDPEKLATLSTQNTGRRQATKQHQNQTNKHKQKQTQTKTNTKQNKHKFLRIQNYTEN